MAQTKYKVNKDTSKRTCNGIVFDSELEMRYYRDVVLEGVKNGTIAEYEMQKVYILQPKFQHEGKSILPIKYVCDFWVKYSDGHEEVIDTKGFADQKAPIKRKMFWYTFPDLTLRWIAYSKMDGGWIDYEELKKKRAERRKKKKQLMEYIGK